MERAEAPGNPHPLAEGLPELQLVDLILLHGLHPAVRERKGDAYEGVAGLAQLPQHSQGLVMVHFSLLPAYPRAKPSATPVRPGGRPKGDGLRRAAATCRASCGTTSGQRGWGIGKRGLTAHCCQAVITSNPNVEAMKLKLLVLSNP